MRASSLRLLALKGRVRQILEKRQKRLISEPYPQSTRIGIQADFANTGKQMAIATYINIPKMGNGTRGGSKGGVTWVMAPPLRPGGPKTFQGHHRPIRGITVLTGAPQDRQGHHRPSRDTTGLVPLGPDRTVTPLTSLKCPRQARGAPDRPEAPLQGRWCPWQACGVHGRPVVPLLGLWCP